MWSLQAEHLNTIYHHFIPGESFDSQPIRQRSNQKHFLDEQQHPTHLLLHSIHTSAVSSHFLLPPITTLSHLTARLSLSYNLSALPMHHSSDHDFIRRYRLFFSTWFFFFLTVTQLVALHHFHFSLSLICWIWGRLRKRISSISIK